MIPLLVEDDDPNWQKYGSCTRVDPYLFFAGKGESDLTRKAKEICSDCYVFNKCSEWSLGFTENVPGVYAGRTETERRKLIKHGKAAAGEGPKDVKRSSRRRRERTKADQRRED